MDSWTAARWTARLALALFVASESLRLANSPAPPADSPPRPRRGSDRLLAGAAAAYLLHAAVACLWVHGGSHGAAWEHTAAQTALWIGVRTGVGLYVNYAFTLLVCLAWAVDARRLRQAARGVAWFLGVQGAVVFAPAPARWVSLGLLVGGPLLGLAWRTARRRRTARPKPD